MADKTETAKAAAAKYAKEQFLGSSRFADHKDVLNALLVEGKTYTTDQVERLVHDFLKKEAK